MRDSLSESRRWSFWRGRVGFVFLMSAVLLSGAVPGTIAALSAAPAVTSGAGLYGPPVWFPLRRSVGGADVKVGCTFSSHGSQGGYDCGGTHPFWALDLLAGTGTAVYPAGAGYARNVTGAGYSGYGNVVVVDHGNNVESLYAHLSVVLVGTSGAWVDQNTVIGDVGETGSATTPHLHFEITASGKFSAGSRDPGPLQACHGSQLVTYPQVWGLVTWQGIPWGTRYAYSDGTGCARITTKAPTVLVADRATRHPLGLLGLGGTRVAYTAHLHTTTGGSPVVGETVVVTAGRTRSCSSLTDATGTAVCVVTYGLFEDPPPRSSYGAAFAGGSSHLPASAAGSIP